MLQESKYDKIIWKWSLLIRKSIDDRALANVQAHLGTAAPAASAPAEPASEAMETDESALPEDVVTKMTETSQA